MIITEREDILQAIAVMLEKHYAVFKQFDVIGVRFDDNAMDDRFDDLELFSDKKKVLVNVATTIPGKYWTEHPMEGLPGTAHVLPGYYRDSHVLGIHGRKWPEYAHEAWIQCGPMRYAQDTNKNGIIETFEPRKESAGAGFNIHRADKNQIVQYVDRHSAGCQVSEVDEEHRAAVQMHKDCMSIARPISYLLTTKEEWKEIIGNVDVREFLMRVA